MSLTINGTTGIETNTDTGKLVVGTGDDLEIYHDGSKSIIADVGTGGLFVAGSSISLTNAAITETMLYAAPDGAVELYHNNVKTCETTTAGIRVLGPEGGAGEVAIYADEGDDNADKWKLVMDGSNVFRIQNYASGSWENAIAMVGDGTVELFHDNSKKFETTSAGVTVTGGLIKDGSGDPIVSNQPSGGNAANPGLQIKNNGTINGSWRYDGRLEIGGQDTDAEIKLDPDGHIYILNDTGKIQLGTSQDLQIYHDGSNSFIKNSGTGSLNLYGDDVGILNAAANEWKAKFISNGQVELYWNNGKKLETYSEGTRVFGYLKATDADSDSHWPGNTHDWNHFHSSVPNNVVVIENSHDSSPYGPYIFFSDAAPDNNTQYFLHFDDNAATRYIVYSDGDVWNHDSAYTGSDETLKENIADATPKLEDLKKLKVRNFNWKSQYFPEKSKKKQLGFIAQEVEQVFPSLVTEHDIAPGIPGDDHTPLMKKAVKQAWAPILVKALQEAVAKIETLETKVATLEAS